MKLGLENPEISVIIPAFRAAAYLATALASATGQTGVSLEIVVVDDGSPEDLAPIVNAASQPVRLIRQAHRGVAAARNTGFEATTAPYLAFLDADDLWCPGALACMLAAARADGDARIIHGRAQVFLDDGEQQAGKRELSPPHHFLSLGSMLLTRRQIELVEGFREEMAYGEDSDLVARLGQAGVGRHMIDDVIQHVRRGIDGLSRRSGLAAQQQAWLQIARKLAETNRRRRSR
ncbi:MAG TPA: glycosyltransferase family A protein [Candidatus Polarisedimenticolia bacterium]|jgi:glycosyltransferase involved in cell wall biosynthesis|nr:glycosyltransferase family A protein [Candidatus Polarisedimenticolia bacterium]